MLQGVLGDVVKSDGAVDVGDAVEFGPVGFVPSGDVALFDRELTMLGGERSELGGEMVDVTGGRLLEPFEALAVVAVEPSADAAESFESLLGVLLSPDGVFERASQRTDPLLESA